MLKSTRSYFCVSTSMIAAVLFCTISTAADREDARLIASAFDAESLGDNSSRHAMLQEALTKNPDNVLARSMLGQIKTDRDWVDVEAAVANTLKDRKVIGYQRLRLRVEGSLPGQLMLAKYCAKHGFADRERFHWRMVLLIQPSNAEAIRALSLRVHEGRLMTAEQIASFKERKTKIEDWRIKTSELAEAIESKRSTADEIEKATAELAGIRAVAAIPSLHRIASRPTQSAADVAAMMAVGEIRDSFATSVLARHAVLSPNVAVRHVATSALKSRPVHEFVPQMLGALTMPIHVTGNVSRLRQGLVYSITTSREGPEADYVHQLYGASDPARPTRANNPARRSQENRAVASIGQQFRRAQERAARTNEQGRALNERLFQTLRATTDQQQLPDQAQPWWDWWAEYNDLYIPDAKPQISTYQQRNVTVRSCECFLAGTLVWTDYGRRPIQQLRAGDRVLTCDPESGAIEYRHILNTTVRPAEETTRLELADEHIVATAGHPIWVIGKGWRMARTIKPGDKLHSVRGAAEVKAVGEGPGAEVYNLVVDGVNNYFVGATGILSHDNTLRQPTRCDIPGHVAKKATP